MESQTTDEAWCAIPSLPSGWNSRIKVDRVKSPLPSGWNGHSTVSRNKTKVIKDPPVENKIENDNDHVEEMVFACTGIRYRVENNPAAQVVKNVDIMVCNTAVIGLVITLRILEVIDPRSN